MKHTKIFVSIPYAHAIIHIPWHTLQVSDTVCITMTVIKYVW
jgi:hypothetical protein